MATYTVKNSAGEWLFYDYDLRAWSWTPVKEARDTWDYKPDAERESRINGGKVYRVRKTAAKRERDRIVDLLCREACCLVGESHAALSRAIRRIERGDHWKAK